MSHNQIDRSAKIYKEALVTSSILRVKASVGDFSKVNNSTLDEYVRIDRNNHIDSSLFGRHSYTGRNTMVLHATIGSFCSISWNVSIGGSNHDYSRMTQHSFLYNFDNNLISDDQSAVFNRYSEKLVIGSDVWIAAGAVITRGISIGNGAVVGANAVVTTDVPPYAIVGGVPAKVIKYRFPPDLIKRLLEIKWWDWSDEKIKSTFHLLADYPTIEKLKGL
jgi:phosphonate metabolism protein (transferase hexapeptide repeat family)